MNWHSILIALLLLSMLVLCGYWQIRENRQLSNRWKRDFDEASSQGLAKFAWARTVQFLSIAAFCIAIIVVYDWQLNEAWDTIDELSVSQSKALNDNTAAENTPDQSGDTPLQPPTSTPSTSTATTYYPPVVSSVFPLPAPPEAPPPAATAQATVPAAPVTASEPTPNEIVNSIYNPAENPGDNQSSLDDLKKRYEDMLVIYFFLKKCGKINANDYHVITSALSQEMASINAPGRLQNDILTAAQGSYKEMYEESSCEGEGLDTLYTQYSNYIALLSKEYTIE